MKLLKWRGALALAASAMLILACTCPLGALLSEPFSPRAETSQPSLDRSATDLPPEDPGPRETPASGISPEVASQMREIELQVVRLRGLQPTGPVERELLSPDQLRQHVLDDFLADYSEQEAADDARLYALLGLLAPDYDVYTLFLDLYSEQIAGFYDDEVKQLYVVQGAGFGGAERITYAHEYTHALQDQRYDLAEGLGYNDEACELDADGCAGLQALVEGDASLLEQQWYFIYASNQDRDDIERFYDELQSPVYDSAPMFLQRDLLFPYEYGYEFVNALFLDGGWAAVDAAYADPPSSTEQILHAERYPRDRPVALEVPDFSAVLGAGWREIDRNVLGEWYTRLVLEERISSKQAEPAAEGWGGDYYLAFSNDDLDQGILVLLTSWESMREAYEFLAAFREYADDRFNQRLTSETNHTSWRGVEGYSTVELRGDQTLWILAPDAETATAVREAVDFPAQRVSAGS